MKQSIIDLTLTRPTFNDNIENMSKVVSIYNAKTNLSKLVKKAQAGETIYIGAYGQPQAMIVPIPTKRPIQIGIWEHKKIPNAYKESELVGSDPEIVEEFENSANKPL